MTKNRDELPSAYPCHCQSACSVRPHRLIIQISYACLSQRDVVSVALYTSLRRTHYSRDAIPVPAYREAPHTCYASENYNALINYML